MKPPRTRSDLTDLYRVAVDEYRFEVRLNWDRMQYFAVVNSGIIAVATGLVRDTQSVPTLIFSGLIFLVGIVTAAIGITVIHRGRDYYQETILKKTVYEHLLGLNHPLEGFDNPRATLAIGTTQGMLEAERILRGRPSVSFFRRLVRNRIQTFFIWLLFLLAAIDLGGAGYCSWRIVTFTPESRPRAAAATPIYNTFNIPDAR